MPYKFEHEFLYRKFPCDQVLEYPQNVTLVGEPGMCNLSFLRCDHHLPKQKMDISFSIRVDMLLPKVFWWKMFVPEKLGGKMVLINSLWRICFFTRVVWSPMFTPYLGKWSSFFRQSFSVAPPLATWYYLMEEIRRSPVEVGSWNPIIYRVLYIPGGAGFRPSTVILDMTCLSKKPKV